MTVATKNGKDVMQVVRAAVAQHGATRDELIPILTEVNHELGYIPHEAVDRSEPPDRDAAEPAVLGRQFLRDAVAASRAAGT